MKKYFVTADVHGFFTEWYNELLANGFDKGNPEHIIVVCGDLLDRGSEPLKCLNFVNDLYDKGRAILIRGNHEDLMEAAIERGYFMQHDMHNGTVQTALDLTGISEREQNGFYDALIEMKNCEPYNTYVKSLVDYAQIDNYIFVHGWIPCTIISNKIYQKIPNWKKGDWSISRWINGMCAWAQGVKIQGKTIICGHYHTSWGHHYINNECSEWGEDAIFNPYINRGIIALDGCTAHTHKVNLFIFESEN